MQHLIVLALENRSFDHIFARRFAPGIRWTTPPLRVAVDPPHEFSDVAKQLAGEWPDPLDASPSSSGDVRRTFAYSREQLPIINALADAFVLFDRWFSAVPGPTWPNRYFMHAGTSGGLVLSPDPGDLGGLLRGNRYDWAGLLGYEFRNGSVFDALDRAGVSWRVYHDDWLPQSASLHGMPAKYVFGWMHGASSFRPLAHLASDIMKPGFPAYTFIEPRWDIGHGYRYGNSQHPVGCVSEGESLIKRVYETLRGSSYWKSSALLVVYDEHGGFFDSIQPGNTVATGDDARYADPGVPFGFEQLGFRVPALLISPWVEAGTVNSDAYDHAAIPGLVAELFGIPRLTSRVRAQPSLSRLFGASLRDDTPARLPDILRGTDTPSAGVKRIDGGFLSVAMMVEQAVRAVQPLDAEDAGRPAASSAGYLGYVRNKLRALRRG